MYMTDPIISYDPQTKEWLVSGGGYWTSNNWVNEAGNFWGYEGESKNIGKRDAFGVGYTSTSGTYKSSVKRSYALISDESGHSVEAKSRSDGNGQLGFGFQLQDYARVQRLYLGGSYDLTYIGRNFGGTCVYSSDFTYYNGNATSYYIHTWDQAVINSINFGKNGKNAGISFDITNIEYSFPAYSNDTPF